MCFGGLSIIYIHIWIPLYPMQASYSHLFNDGISPTIVLSSIPFFFVGRAISGKFVPKLIEIFGLKFLNALNILLNFSYYLLNI